LLPKYYSVVQVLPVKLFMCFVSVYVPALLVFIAHNNQGFGHWLTLCTLNMRILNMHIQGLPSLVDLSGSLRTEIIYFST